MPCSGDCFTLSRQLVTQGQRPTWIERAARTARRAPTILTHKKKKSASKQPTGRRGDQTYESSEDTTIYFHSGSRTHGSGDSQTVVRHLPQRLNPSFTSPWRRPHVSLEQSTAASAPLFMSDSTTFRCPLVLGT